MMMEARKFVLIFDIVSDTMCPWCWVGKKNLEFTLKETPEDVDIKNINWLPYFLDLTLSEEGTSTEEYYQKNYGDARAGERMKPLLISEGRKAGIDFTTYFNITHFRPTLRSHRLIEYAKQNGKQEEMVEALFRMYCEEGKALNDISALTQVAERIGLNGSNVRAYLQSKSNEQQVLELARSVRGDHSHGVPTFIFSLCDHKDVTYTLSGAQPPEVFTNVLEKLVAHKKRLKRLDQTKKD